MSALSRTPSRIGILTLYSRRPLFTSLFDALRQPAPHGDPGDLATVVAKNARLHALGFTLEHHQAVLGEGLQLDRTWCWVLIANQPPQLTPPLIGESAERDQVVTFDGDHHLAHHGAEGPRVHRQLGCIQVEWLVPRLLESEVGLE